MAAHLGKIQKESIHKNEVKWQGQDRVKDIEAMVLFLIEHRIINQLCSMDMLVL